MMSNNIDLYKKDKAIKRYNFIKELDYTDSEYKKNLRKHMANHRQNARGLLNPRLTAKQELLMYEMYGFESMKTYALDVLKQNIEYCTVLEAGTHDEQISLTEKFLRESNNKEYLLTLKPFSTKNGNSWYTPVDRLVNWIDCYMIQRDVFFRYANKDEILLYLPSYFQDNILSMITYTENEEMDFDNDIDEIAKVYDTLVNGVIDILESLPEDRMIDNLFTMDYKQIKKNKKIIRELGKDYLKLME